jgi:hypothetical protein
LAGCERDGFFRHISVVLSAIIFRAIREFNIGCAERRRNERRCQIVNSPPAASSDRRRLRDGDQPSNPARNVSRRHMSIFDISALAPWEQPFGGFCIAQCLKGKIDGGAMIN